MRTAKITVSIDRNLLTRLDRLVQEKRFPSRSRAVQEAVRDKLRRLQRGRLAHECSKLDPGVEQALANEWLEDDCERWPEY